MDFLDIYCRNRAVFRKDVKGLQKELFCSYDVLFFNQLGKNNGKNNGYFTEQLFFE